MGGLKFNDDLCVFEEDEDPLQNSLHLEDLPNLSASTLNDDSHSESSSSTDSSAASVSKVPIRPRALNLGYLMPDDTIHGVGSVTTGTYEAQGNKVIIDDASIVREFDALPRPPSCEEKALGTTPCFTEKKDSLSSNNRESLPVCQRPNTAEILKQLEEEEHSIQKLSRSPLRVLSGKNGRAKAKRCYTNIEYLVMNDQNLPIEKRRYDNSDSCSYSIPVLTSSKSGDTVMSSVLGKSCRLSQGLKKTQIINVNKPHNSDSVSRASSTTSFSSRMSQAIMPHWMRKRKEKNREKKNALTRARDLMFLRNNQTQQSAFNDDESIDTTVQMKNEPSAGTVIENMEKLNMLITNQETYGKGVQERCLNVSWLDTPSVGSLSTAKESSSTTITSIKSTAKKRNLSIARPHVLNLQDRVYSAPVLKPSKPSNLTTKNRSTSDSPVVVTRKALSQHHFSRSEIRMSKGIKELISISPRSISSSKSSRSIFNRSNSKKDSTSKSKGQNVDSLKTRVQQNTTMRNIKKVLSMSPRSKLSSRSSRSIFNRFKSKKYSTSNPSNTQVQRNKTSRTIENTIPYPLIRFDQNSNFNRSIEIPQDDDTMSCITVESSFDSASMSDVQTSFRNTPIKNRSHHQPLPLKTSDASTSSSGINSTRASVGKPSSHRRSNSDQRPSNKTLLHPTSLRRTQSLQTPEHLHTSIHSRGGTKYTSLSLNTPSSNGSHASTPRSLGTSSDQIPFNKNLQAPTSLRRTKSLQPPKFQSEHLSHLNTSINSSGGTKYASHLLSSPSSISSHALYSPTASKSLSSFLQSPSRYSSQGYQNDASSIASGASLASTYTALSNLSYKDPCAKPSKTIKRSNLDISGEGDGDIWVEKIFVSKRSGKQRTFFISVATGRRVRDEPPTGASKVIYQDDLKELRRIEAEEARQLNTNPDFCTGTMSSC